MLKVKFRDGRTATYTQSVLDLLLTDSDVVEVIDLRTGELLKWSDEE